jgi:hypothetical protein
MLKEREEESLITTVVGGSRPEPVTLESGGERLYAMYYPPTGEAPLGPRVAVLVL